MYKLFILPLFLLLSVFKCIGAQKEHIYKSEQVTFFNEHLELRGVLYKPTGKGPFPAVLYNHGSSPGMDSSQASAALGPLYAAKGWVFFMPYRRGQGLSASAGPYIMDEIQNAYKAGGTSALTKKMITLLTTDHLSDQLAGLAWLRKQKFVVPGRIAVAGNSFGGIETILGAEKGNYCAAVDASGAAQSWAQIPALQTLMINSAKKTKTPIFFFQAENDYNLAPSKILAATMKNNNKKYEMKIYPRFGSTEEEGHSFAYLGGHIWSKDVFTFLQRNCLE